MMKAMCSSKALLFHVLCFTLLARGSPDKDSSFMGCFIWALGGPLALHNEFLWRDPRCLERTASWVLFFYKIFLPLENRLEPRTEETKNSRLFLRKNKIYIYIYIYIYICVYIYVYIYILQGLKKSHPRNNHLLGLFGIAWGRTCLYCPLLLPDLLKDAGCKTIAVHLTHPLPESLSPNVKDTLG